MERRRTEDDVGMMVVATVVVAVRGSVGLLLLHPLRRCFVMLMEDILILPGAGFERKILHSSRKEILSYF